MVLTLAFGYVFRLQIVDRQTEPTSIFIIRRRNTGSISTAPQKWAMACSSGYGGPLIVNPTTVIGNNATYRSLQRLVPMAVVRPL